MECIVKVILMSEPSVWDLSVTMVMLAQNGPLYYVWNIVRISNKLYLNNNLIITLIVLD